MFSRIKKYYEEQQLKRLLLPFYAEIKANLERYYVMDQRQFIDGGFQTERWEQVKSHNGVHFSLTMTRYTQAMQEFNQMFSAFKEFERWYAADLLNKTPENAKKLHTQKAELDRRLKKLDELIIPAGEELERVLIDKKIIK